jgi:hypothetical protein
MIEFLAIGLLIVALINTALLYKIAVALNALLDVNKKWGQPSQAEKDLASGKHDAVIERSLKDITENPKHAKAHWHLAKAYYEKEMWNEAKTEMEIVARLQPSWRSESVDPYIQEIAIRLNADSDSHR